MKTHVDQLAVFEGPPLFEHAVAVGRPNLPDEAVLFARLQRMLDSRWLTNHGPAGQEFESEVARHLGVAHCVACANATLGLQLVAKALDLEGEVILPSFTFVGTAHALEWIGLQPVFCDIDPATHCISPQAVEALITPRTTAILGVHVWGRACPIKELTALAQRYNLKLFFDAAHAFGCTYQEQMLGGFGSAEVFSFHATKVINTFEGGVVTTQDATLAERIRSLRNYGFDVDGIVRSHGINAKLSEAHACMGLVMLKELEKIVEHNRGNYGAYQKELQGLPGLNLLSYASGERHHYHYVVIEIDESRFGLHRDSLEAILIAEGIFARRYFHPGCHRLEPYVSGPTVRIALTATEALADRVLCLPTGTQITADGISSIASLIRFCHERADAIRSRMSLCVAAKVK